MEAPLPKFLYFLLRCSFQALAHLASRLFCHFDIIALLLIKADNYFYCSHFPLSLTFIIINYSKLNWNFGELNRWGMKYRKPEYRKKTCQKCSEGHSRESFRYSGWGAHQIKVQKTGIVQKRPSRTKITKASAVLVLNHPRSRARIPLRGLIWPQVLNNKRFRYFGQGAHQIKGQKSGNVQKDPPGPK